METVATGADPTAGQAARESSRASSAQTSEDGSAHAASNRSARAHAAAPPSVWALLQGIGEDIKTLAAQQVRLAVHEVQMEIARIKLIAGLAVGLLVLALVFAVAAMLGVIAALHEFAGLSLLMSSLLVVGMLVAAAAGLTLYLVQQLRRLRFYPVRTWHTLKEDVRWITEQLVSRKT